jgi:MFS family permease
MDGLAAAALWPCMSAIMALSVPRQAKAAAMSVFNAAYCLGVAVGPMLGFYLGHVWGSNRDVFPLCAAVMLAGYLLAFKYIPHRAERVELATESFGEERNLLRGRPMLVKMMVLFGLSQVGVGILGPTLPIYIDSQFGIKEADLPRLIAIPALLIIAVALPLGRVADIVGRAKALWLSYLLAVAGVSLMAASSLFRPEHSLTSLPALMFGLGAVLIVAWYIVATPAWVGLTSLQVTDRHQVQALSLMQTSQGLGVVVALAVVASAGHLMASAGHLMNRARDAASHLHHFGHHGDRLRHLFQGGPTVIRDHVPLSIWFWVSATVFLLCLLGTLLFVRDTDHYVEVEAEEEDALLGPG